MMHYAPVAGAEFHGTHVHIAVDIHRQHETAVLVGAVWRHCELLSDGQDLVRLTARPALREHRWRLLVPGIAFRRSGLGPFADQRKLRIGEPPLIGKRTIS